MSARSCDGNDPDCPVCGDKRVTAPRRPRGPSDVEIAAWREQMRRLFGDDVISEWEGRR